MTTLATPPSAGYHNRGHPCVWPLHCVKKPGSSAARRALVKSRASAHATARQQERVRDAIAQANRRVGRPATAPVVRGEESGLRVRRAGGQSGSWQGQRAHAPVRGGLPLIAVVPPAGVAPERAGVGRCARRRGSWRRYEQGARHVGQVVRRARRSTAEARRPRHRGPGQPAQQERARTRHPPSRVGSGGRGGA